MKFAILLVEPTFNQNGWAFYTEFSHHLIMAEIPFLEVKPYHTFNEINKFRHEHSDHTIISIFLPLRRGKPGTGDYGPGEHSQKIIQQLINCDNKFGRNSTPIYALRKPKDKFVLGKGIFRDMSMNLFHVNSEDYIEFSHMLVVHNRSVFEEPLPASKTDHSKPVYYDVCGVEIDEAKICVTGSNVPMILDDCFSIKEPATINKTREMNLLLLLCSQNFIK